MKTYLKNLAFLTILSALVFVAPSLRFDVAESAQMFPDVQTGYSSYLTGSISSTASSIVVGSAPSVSTGFLMIEPRTNNAEIVYMTGRSGTTLTVTRGLANTGTSTTGLSGTQRGHGAGSKVEMVDVHYYIKLIQAAPVFSFRGATTTTGLSYLLTPEVGDTVFNTSDSSHYYYTGSAWNSVSAPASAGDASISAKGVVELATAVEAASSTATGSAGPLVLPASLATSTYNSSGSLQVVMTNNSNKIDSNFISTTSLPSYFDFGDGSDGDVTISSPATTTRDMYYNNLTVNSTLATGNYRIFVRGTLSGNGTITALGNHGSGSTGGATTTGYFVTPGGTAGGAAVSDANGLNGGESMNFAVSFNTFASGRGGTGGTANRTPGNGGVVGLNFGTTTSFGRTLSSINSWNDINSTTSQIYRLSTGSGGTGGGSGATNIGSGTSGAGGGGGSTGGVIFVATKTNSSTISFSASGGNGANGSGGSITTAGGGGGGGGGKGGTVIFIYKTGSAPSVCTVTGGTGGAGGAPAGAAGTGSTGNNGADGICIYVDVDNLIN